MRRFGLSLGLLLTLATPAFADLAGTARVGTRLTQYAVVWLEAPGSRYAAKSKVTLDQRNLTFLPHVLAVRVGTTVEFPNNDKVFHNVFSFRDGKKFNLGLYPTGTSKSIVFDQPGLARIFCDIHPNMAAYVIAIDTPYFAVSDEHGAFSIAGVPAGTYTYHAWRPGGQPLTGSITVDAERTLEVKW
jgi:plastocyanin